MYINANEIKNKNISNVCRRGITKIQGDKIQIQNTDAYRAGAVGPPPPHSLNFLKRIVK